MGVLDGFFCLGEADVISILNPRSRIAGSQARQAIKTMDEHMLEHKKEINVVSYEEK